MLYMILNTHKTAEISHLCPLAKNVLLFFLQEGVFFKIGMLMGVSLVQGGSGFPFFAPSQYQYICSGDVRSVVVGRSEVPHQQIDDAIDKVCDFYLLCVLSYAHWSV